MSNKRTLKSLIGVGAFACCSAVLLSVTAQSAQSRQIPSVSELGDMIGGTIRFYQSLNMESEAAGAGAAVTEESAQTAVIPEDPIPEEPEDVSRAVFSLPDFTEEDPPAGTPTGTQAAVPDTAGMVTAAVIDEEEPGITDSLSLTSADPSSSPVSLTSSAAGEDDWMEGDGSGKKADEPADEKPAEEPSAGKEKSTPAEEKKEAAAGDAVVEVRDAAGQPVRTDTISWAELESHSDSSSAIFRRADSCSASLCRIASSSSVSL